MSKALEALEVSKQLKDFVLEFVKNGLDRMFINGSFDIIERELKEYELMKQVRIIVVDKKISDDDSKKLKNQRMFISNLEQCEIKPLFDEKTQKKLKALEILKDWFEVFEDENGYHLRPLYDIGRINKEKYDLLKEALL